MKKLITLFSLFTFTFSLSHAQTADDIIGKYITALGGKKKLDAIKNIYMEGNIEAQGQKIPVKMWRVNKKSMRVEYTFNGMTGYSIVRTDSGWSFQPFAGQKQAEPMTADEVKSAQNDLDIEGALVDYKSKGYKVTYEGKDDVDGTDAYKIKVVISDSLTETYYIDLSTYYILRVKTKATVNGKVTDGTEDLSDYQKTSDGYIFPMSSGGNMNGDMKFTVVKVNTDINKKLFMPAK